MIPTPADREETESTERPSETPVDEPRTDKVRDWLLWWQSIDERLTAQAGCGSGWGSWHGREPDGDEWDVLAKNPLLTVCYPAASDR